MLRPVPDHKAYFTSTYPSKLHMWSMFPHSFPVPVGQSVDGGMGVGDVLTRIRQLSENSGYGCALLTTHISGFHRFQSAELLHTLHDGEGRQDIYGSESP